MKAFQLIPAQNSKREDKKVKALTDIELVSTLGGETDWGVISRDIAWEAAAICAATEILPICGVALIAGGLGLLL